MHPGGKVHLSSGLLPRSSRELARDWVAPGLSVLAPSVRCGPLLIDADKVRLPKVAVVPRRAALHPPRHPDVVEGRPDPGRDPVRAAARTRRRRCRRAGSGSPRTRAARRADGALRLARAAPRRRRPDRARAARRSPAPDGRPDDDRTAQARGRAGGGRPRARRSATPRSATRTCGSRSGPSVMTNGQAGGNPNVAGRIRDVQIESDRTACGSTRPAPAAAPGSRPTAARRGARSTTSRRPIAAMSAASPARWRAGRSTSSSAADADGSKDVVWVGTGEPSLFGGGQPGRRRRPAGRQARRDRLPAPRSGRRSGMDDRQGRRCLGRSRHAARCAVLSHRRRPGQPRPARGGDDERALPAPGGRRVDPCGELSDGGRPPARRRAHPPHRTRSRPDLGRRPQRRAGRRVRRRTGHGDQPGEPVLLDRSRCPNVNINAPPATRRHARAAGHRRQQGLRARTPRHRRRGEALDAPGRSLVDRRDRRARQPQRHRDHRACPSTSSCRPATSPTTTCASRRTRPRPAAIYVGGAAVSTSTGWNGAIYRCEIAGTTATPTLIGEGVHADVHVAPHRPGRARPTGQAHRVGRLRRRPLPLGLRRRCGHLRQPQRRPRRPAARLRRQPPDQPGHRRRRLPGQRHRGPHGRRAVGAALPGRRRRHRLRPGLRQPLLPPVHPGHVAQQRRRRHRARPSPQRPGAGHAEDLRDDRGRLVALLLRRRRRRRSAATSTWPSAATASGTRATGGGRG